MSTSTAQAIEQFLASLRTRSAPANTIKAYRLDLQQFVRAVPATLEEVTADQPRLSPRSRKGRILAIQPPLFSDGTQG